MLNENQIRERPLIPMDLKIRTMFGLVVTHQPTQKSEHLQ